MTRRRVKSAVARGMITSGTGKGRVHTTARNTRRARAKSEREQAADVTDALTAKPEERQP